MLGLDPAAWAGIGGSILGAIVGGAISWRIQVLGLREARASREATERAHQKALAQSTLLKAIRIYSTLKRLSDHLSKSYLDAPADWKQHPHKFLLPIAALPSDVEFSDSERSLILELGNFELTNVILNLDVSHNRIIDLFRSHAVMRRDFQEKLPAVMEGGSTVAYLTLEQALLLGPPAAAIDQLVEQLGPMLLKWTDLAKSAVHMLQAVMRDKLDIRLNLNFEA